MPSRPPRVTVTEPLLIGGLFATYCGFMMAARTLGFIEHALFHAEP
jgi:hypothetical protein